ncbi:helix-turn-helix transcriptional regulator [Candidatus Micrarchaeota archaeon]|nr:helix-turn-helix transcriptional regulator [Candidatus Micrarchaeota archaeon]
MQEVRPIRRLKRHLTIENLWLYLLSLIKERGKIYAYNLPEEIEQEFFFRPSRVMIYIVLNRLEDEKLISSEMEEKRKYYKMTKKGRKTLEDAKEYFSLLAERL